MPRRPTPPDKGSPRLASVQPLNMIRRPMVEPPMERIQRRDVPEVFRIVEDRVAEAES